MNKNEREHEVVQRIRAVVLNPEDPEYITKKFLACLLDSIEYKKRRLEKALLWVIHEQCEYAGKAYAKFLIHGEEAFDALGLEDECDIIEIEKRLFKEE